MLHRMQARVRALIAFARPRLAETWAWFPLFAIVVLVLAWGALIDVLEVERAAVTFAAVKSSRELADTYEAQVVRSLVSIDQTLKTVAYAYAVSGNAALAELQNRDMLPSAIVFQMAITNSRGDVTASTRSPSPGNVADQPYFLAQRQSDRLFISRTRTDRDSHAPALIFSRRLSDAAGAFAGVVTLAVDPSYFTSSYDSLRMGRHGFLGLLGTDGSMRVQQTGEDVSWGARVRAGLDSADATEEVADQPWDGGVERFTNVRALHGFPLVAIVGLSRDEQLARYRHDRWVYIGETAAGSLLLVVLTTILSLKSRELLRSRARARRLRQTYFAASDASRDAFFVWERVPSESEGESLANVVSRAFQAADFSFVLRDVSKRGLEMMGKPREALIGALSDDVLLDLGEGGTSREFAQVFETGEVAEREWRHVLPDGSRVWLHRQLVRVDDGVVAIVRDVTARKRSEVMRAEQNRVLEMIATSTPLEDVLSALMHLLESQIPDSACAVMLRDEDGQHLRVGAAPSLPAAFSQLANGWTIGPDAGPSGVAIYTHQPVSIGNLLASVPHWDFIQKAHMQEYSACRSMPILSHEGSALGALTVFARGERTPDEIEAQTMAMATRIAGIAIERTRAEDSIRHMANHDALTGLPNRTLLGDRLSQALLHARRYTRGVSVAFVDLDNFKLINDSLGHHAGDELLKTIAGRMRDCVRSTDTVVRLGGDEFVLVLFDDQLGEEELRAVIERLRKAISEPVHLNGQSYKVTCSMGFARYPGDGEDAQTLLMNADAAMYRAKEMGRNNFQFYTSEMNIKVHERLRRREQLRVALEENQFRLVYQPQVDVRTGTIFGVEALLRWDHPIEGTISPADFIPIAEETGLILPIGDWVLETACMQNRRWQDEGLPPITVSVNVSAHQFLQKRWIDEVAKTLARTGLAPQYLELELTESLIMRDLEASIEAMQRLEDMGVRLSIDDFGTGYSSLSALKHFPVGRLKIDKSFVRELPHGEDDKAIAIAVISLGQRLNLSVIAEGVETQAQVDFLSDNNCHEIQGYHFSRPVAPGEIEAMLRATGPVAA
ncbi:bifunctional diguanylate cyclase/phosphodiesterase [Trinickia dinghuensis]|uniref:bifunctional diguanylate cyclase/phosphodiesterase n=1 Tax=Trinickia dinghuensis TaxID=2291023 RepID=UPI0015F15B45|nr:EAL domain-containing protein [Trinickia dinghuensis]